MNIAAKIIVRRRRRRRRVMLMEAEKISHRPNDERRLEDIQISPSFSRIRDQKISSASYLCSATFLYSFITHCQ